jgi:hypothetical protein
MSRYVVDFMPSPRSTPRARAGHHLAASSLHTVQAALRRAGVADPTRVRFAVLEESGGISVVPFTSAHPQPS